ncbi:hypothetical protein PVAND_004714 [Polypedilum vanderplanki]|uniref:Structure-specific endonuclease subunit SLX4 n=1 Tax=Polypedilum vanderplanki TaxID=319348 RepID=A0A9J6BXZ0_POLVA|nr:hypothetical protein PVAND_004714 [Polypedilum vanderplanki]
MSDKEKKRAVKKNLVTNFIEKKNTEEEKDEPTNKKLKLNENADDSLNFFKKLEKYRKAPSTSKNVTKAEKSKTTKITRAKKSKSSSKVQPDIRKALSKHDLVQNAITESCHQDLVDPYEMQLALAISESLKDQQKAQEYCESSTSSSISSDSTKTNKPKLENPFTAKPKMQHISTVLEKYGFKKKNHNEIEPEDDTTKMEMSLRSRYMKYPTKLVLTKFKEKERLNALSVDYILESCFGDCQKIREEITECTQLPVHCYYLQEMTERHNTIFSKQSVETHSETMLMDFYVSELFKPSFIGPGYLLKDYNKIYGRISTPKKKRSKSDEKKDEEKVEMQHEKIEEIPQFEIKEETSIENEKEEPEFENVEDKSCSDIFDGIESFSCESPENLQKVSPSKCEKNYLENQLDVINEKFSQNSETVEMKEKQVIKKEVSVNVAVETNDFDKIETVTIFSSESNDSTVEYSFDENLEKMDCDHIDLTQRDDSDVEEIEMVTNSQENIQYSQNSQTSTSGEIIDISDEEINYSIQACNVDNLPTNDDENVFEIDNVAEQTLIELLAVNDDHLNASAKSVIDEINATVNCCMEDVKVTANIKAPQFSSSILEILNKYKSEEENNFDDVDFSDNDEAVDDEEPLNYEVPMDNEDYLEKTLSNNVNAEKNMDTDEGDCSGISAILRKYNMPNKENQNVQKNQNIEKEQDVEEDSDQEIVAQNSRSIRKSLDNILNTSLVTKSAKKQPIPKPQRKSFGINLNGKYIIDTESYFDEPHYSSMTPVELKKELYKFGIRTLPVKKAVELLTHIYDQTHPIIRVKASEEVDMNDSRAEMNYTDFVSNIGIQSSEENFVFQLDSNGIVDGEEYILPKTKKSKVPTCALPLHIAFYNMVRSNEKYPKFILEFRPLDLDEIYRHFRKFNLSYQLSDIISFLDKRCITFKTKEQSYSKRHQKKKKAKQSQNE